MSLPRLFQEGDSLSFVRRLLLSIWEIVRRFHMGHSIYAISHSLGYDRKTVRSYIRL